MKFRLYSRQRELRNIRRQTMGSIPRNKRIYSSRHNNYKIVKLGTDSAAKLMYKCNICSQTYNTLSSLLNHLDRLHMVEKEFQCSICGKFFHYGGRAIDHFLKIHPGIEMKIVKNKEFAKNNV